MTIIEPRQDENMDCNAPTESKMSLEALKEALQAKRQRESQTIGSLLQNISLCFTKYMYFMFVTYRALQFLKHLLVGYKIFPCVLLLFIRATDCQRKSNQ